ncbi:hypothetical protein [Haloferula sp. A504]|uniref:hypothetical protein n=1 Tax=Haloferula sp. A504 TaxID=3373601 RepID=UPI0031CA238F|nr:hypothetical protein [Verrucomicrobiaceae bacterium E54]
MSDPIHQRFVDAQKLEAERFVAMNPGFCEILSLPDARFLVHLDCPVMRLRPGRPPVRGTGCHIGITFRPDYCRRPDPQAVSILTPFIFHPNIVGTAACLGRMAPATPIVDLLLQVYEMLVWKTYSAHDPMNPEAAQWARNHADEVPLEADRSVRIPKPAEAANPTVG